MGASLAYLLRVLWGALGLFAVVMAGTVAFGFPTTDWLGGQLGLSVRSEAILFFALAAAVEEVGKLIGATMMGVRGAKGQWFYAGFVIALIFATFEALSKAWISDAWLDPFAWQPAFALFRVVLLHVSLTLLALMVARLFHGRWYGFIAGLGVATAMHTLNNLTAFGAFGPMEPYVAFTTAGAFAAIIAVLFHLRFRLSWTCMRSQ